MESKEEYCKCCKQVWYKKMLKKGLCPNCYDYVKKLEEKNKVILKNSCENLIDDSIYFLKKSEKANERLELFFKIFKDNNLHFYYIKDKDTGLPINEYGLPDNIISDAMVFVTEEKARHHIAIDQLFNCEVVEIKIVEELKDESLCD